MVASRFFFSGEPSGIREARSHERSAEPAFRLLFRRLGTRRLGLGNEHEGENREEHRAGERGLERPSARTGQLQRRAPSRAALPR